MEKNKIYHGSALPVLKTFPDGSIDCCVTSPPYWGLRDYGVSGQLGLEPTFELYIKHLMQIYAEVWRVLKPTGTVWVNLGDTYVSHDANQKSDRVWNEGTFVSGSRLSAADAQAQVKKSKIGLPAKSLCCIPDRFKIAMVDSGWICRNELIWYKRNCMPSSASDRFTVDFEKIYFFTKQGKYYFEQQFEELKITGVKGIKFGGNKGCPDNPTYSGNEYNSDDLQGRNMRTVWQINTQPYKEAHFAVFPPELPRRCIMAGCPKDICKKCGKAREKVYEVINRTPIKKDCLTEQYAKSTHGNEGELISKGYSDCGCNAGWDKCVVLDPFMGSGTTALVAKQLGRDYIGIELNEKYIALAEERLNREPDPLF
jgi:DNA modification methylase